MRFGSAIVVLGIALSLVCEAQLQQQSSIYFSVPPADAPELAHRGTYSVGVRTVELLHPNQVDILHFDSQTGKAPLYNRALKVEVWYPATIPPGKEESTTYISAMPGRSEEGASGRTFEIKGKALRNAPPLHGSRFPLVLVSHGYPGSRTFLTYLTENLASKGYVVAAIDHTDSVFGEVRGFQSTLLNRSNDQLFTMEALEKLSTDPNHFLQGLVDATNIAIIGYSMGGYGALTSAGAGYSKGSALMKFVPGNYLDEWAADNPKFQSLDRKAVKAIVAIAPWGEQPPYLAWDAGGLAAIHVPSLLSLATTMMWRTTPAESNAFSSGPSTLNGICWCTRMLAITRAGTHRLPVCRSITEPFNPLTSRCGGKTVLRRSTSTSLQHSWTYI